MAAVVKMPKMGINMTEGTIVEILHKEGDTVAKGDALFEIETDKSTANVEAPEDGKLLKIIGELDETYDCGTVIAIVGKDGDDISGLA